MAATADPRNNTPSAARLLAGPRSFFDHFWRPGAAVDSGLCVKVVAPPLAVRSDPERKPPEDLEQARLSALAEVAAWINPRLLAAVPLDLPLTERLVEDLELLPWDDWEQLERPLADRIAEEVDHGLDPRWIERLLLRCHFDATATGAWSDDFKLLSRLDALDAHPRSMRRCGVLVVRRRSHAPRRPGARRAARRGACRAGPDADSDDPEPARRPLQPSWRSIAGGRL